MSVDPATEPVTSPARRLVVLRHAKAAPAPGLADVERPLTERGEKEAAAAGRWLQEVAVGVDLVICSTARRTRQTWDIVSPELASRPRVYFDERVYRNTVDDLLAVVGEAPDEVVSVLLVCHNPAAQHLVAELTAGAAPDLPTCGMALLELGRPWTSPIPESGALVRTWAPSR